MTTGELQLRVLSGLPADTAPLVVDPQSGAVLGRGNDCSLVIDHPAVSRRHARIDAVAGTWTMRDLGSRHGTKIDGTTLTPNDPVQLRPGSRIDLGPVALRVERSGGSPIGSTLVDAESQARARVVQGGGAMAARRLESLIAIVGMLQRAGTEDDVVTAVLPELVKATGFARCVFVRGVDASGSADVRAAYPEGSMSKPLSRTLLNAAAAGQTVELAEQPDLAGAVSLIMAEIVGAVCAPVVIDEVAESFLYLDASGDHVPSSDAGPFCRAIAEIVAMCVSNIRRETAEAERRALVEDLGAARSAQERLMPEVEGEIGGFRYRLASVPGRFVAGDIVGLHGSDDRLTAYLGDVSGKGAGAAMLMSAIQAHVTAQFACGRMLQDAVNGLGEFVCTHAGAGRFATMFFASFDASSGNATVIDAGHGYAVLVDPVHGPRAMTCDGGPPIGAVSGWSYDRSDVAWPVGARIVIFSDGVAEQLDADGHQLGLDRIVEVLSRSETVEGDVSGILTTLEAHAGGTHYADDVTVLSIERIR
ncbi:MAG: FHA domain-containing protein [Phycisphaerae bacterium]|nr:FHA domain-containing protein [Phycisphaerae bacterium]